MLCVIELEIEELYRFEHLCNTMKNGLIKISESDCGIEMYQNSKSDIELIENVVKQVNIVKTHIEQRI
jgi:hypothetical protein